MRDGVHGASVAGAFGGGAMTSPKQWWSLIQRVTKRLGAPGAKPSSEGMVVLQSILVRTAEGEAVPSQAQLGEELGIGEKRVRAALRELQGLWLILAEPDPEDGRRHVLRPNRALIAAWADGDYELAMDRRESQNEGDRGQNGADLTGDSGRNGAYPGQSSGQNGAFPRVRAAESSSSASSSSQSSAPASSQEAFAEHQAMLASLTRWGIAMPPAAREYVWRWVGRYPVARVAAAAEASWRFGAKNFAYVERVLASEDARSEYPDATSVVRFADYRSLRPWHGDQETGGGEG